MKAKGKLKSLIDRDLVNALSHPLRVHILDALNERISSPSDLAREVGLDVNYVAYHVKELEKIGYLELVKTEPRRGAVEHYYRASARLLLDDAEWERLPPTVKNGLAANTFSAIAEDMREALEAGTFAARNSHLTRTRLLLDEKGWEDLSAALTDTLERIFAIQAECEERIGQNGEKPISTLVSMASFEASPPRSPEADAGPAKLPAKR
jgi:DNA-binding MarR family transcriptional regulator